MKRKKLERWDNAGKCIDFQANENPYCYLWIKKEFAYTGT